MNKGIGRSSFAGLEDEVQLRRFCEGKMIKAFSAEKRRLLKADLEDVPLHDRLQMCNDERCQIEFVSA